MEPKWIRIRGARTHNLKNIDVDLPRNRLVVFTGLSGSGKSSLAFDTLYAEGQRRYVESLSTYARQFLGQMGKPEVESIDGLSPAVAIEQRTTASNPRSTVGTITEIHDFLRLLFARVGHPHCPRCGREIRALSLQDMVNLLSGYPEGTRVMLLAPLVEAREGKHQELLAGLRRKGFVRVRIDGEVRSLDETPVLEESRRHNIEAVIDRLVIKPGVTRRLAESVTTAVTLAEGFLLVHFPEDKSEFTLSEKAACLECGRSLPALEPQLFSFNNPKGACPECSGLGIRNSVARVPPVTAPGRVSEAVQELERSTGEEPCPLCGGARLRSESLAVRVGGWNIHELAMLAIDRLAAVLASLTFPPQERLVADRIRQEIGDRLVFLEEVGLSYLTLARRASSLSGGEAQRLRLSSQLGSRLAGVLYILDEPSIGLHQRDNRRLLRTLLRLRDAGNTVLVVEHDAETILAADHVLDMGPGAGVQGGQVIYNGPVAGLLAEPDSLTGGYLSGRLAIEVPRQRRRPTGRLAIRKATANNLREVSVEIPLGVVTCVTGVSGSGKSSLVVETLYKEARFRLNRAHSGGAPGSVEGLEQIDKVIDIDQSPIGRTPRSNPATFTGVYAPIRELFSRLPEARARGYKASRFSFNLKGGRCEACEGEGVIRIAMHFLPDLYVTCDTCRGARFNDETLEVRFRDRSIADVLAMTIGEALDFFANIPPIRHKLRTLVEVGLSYPALGQSAVTLSGGEAQRIKLGRELARRTTGRTLYILDEPTTGLHPADISQLLAVLNQLADAGNTVVIIEHNLDVIKTADHVIDLGPEGGEGGGRVMATGTPEQIARHPESHTGVYLKLLLA